MKIKIIFMALAAIFVCAANAQTISGQDLRERYLQAYADLGDYIKLMSDASISIEKRQEYMSLAFNLFYCKGESYMEDGVTMPAPKIVVKSNGRTSKQTLKAFLSKLANGIYAGTFTITDTSIPHFPVEINVSSMRQVNDSIFALETTVSQQFSGYKDGRVAYEDVTAKRVKVYLQKINVGGKDVFKPLLTGDIYVIEKKSH